MMSVQAEDRAMRWGMTPSRDTDAMKSRVRRSPNSPIESSSGGQATKKTAHDIDEANRKRDWSTARVVDTELILKQGMDSDSLSIQSKLPFSLTDVFTSGRGLFQSQHFGAAQGGSSLPLFKPEIPHRCPSTSRLPVSLSTPPIRCFHSCNGSVASHRVPQ